MKPEEGSLAPGWQCGVVNTAAGSFRVSPAVTGLKRRGSFWLKTGCLARPRSWLAAMRALCRALGLASLPSAWERRREDGTPPPAEGCRRGSGQPCSTTHRKRIQM